MSVLLRFDVVVELTVDKSIRVVCPGKFAVATNARGSASCLMHPDVRVYQEETRLAAQFGTLAPSPLFRLP